MGDELLRSSDYCCASTGLRTCAVRAINDLLLGSDHRIIQFRLIFILYIVIMENGTADYAWKVVERRHCGAAIQYRFQCACNFKSNVILGEHYLCKSPAFVE